MKEWNLIVKKYVHDCSCRVQNAIQGILCKECLLDAYHSKKHKCGMKAFEMKGSNGGAAEQLWSRLDILQPTVSHFSRPHYRCFLKHYCIWRNSFVKSTSTPDINPSISRRRAQKRKRR